jgi:hypothetical protein
MSIRSFLYLDEYKLYSFSSQMFSGLTEHVVSFSNRSREHKEHREPQSKAQLVAEIASEQTGTAEKRFLHDHAYNLFERELESRKAIRDVGGDAVLSDFHKSGFVRVSGPAVVMDAHLVKNTVSRINEIAAAFSYVTSFKQVQEAREAAMAAADATRDRNARAKVNQQLKQLSPENLSKLSGMRLDEKYVKQLTYLLEYGYGDHLQLQIPVSLDAGGELLISAVLKRGALRESEALLVQKYARVTDRPITLVGIPTQAGGAGASRSQKGEQPQKVKEVMAQMISHLSAVEESFTGRLDNEVILDPIAAYVEMDGPDWTDQDEIVREG